MSKARTERELWRLAARLVVTGDGLCDVLHLISKKDLADLDTLDRAIETLDKVIEECRRVGQTYNPGGRIVYWRTHTGAWIAPLNREGRDYRRRLCLWLAQGGRP